MNSQACREKDDDVFVVVVNASKLTWIHIPTWRINIQRQHIFKFYFFLIFLISLSSYLSTYQDESTRLGSCRYAGNGELFTSTRTHSSMNLQLFEHHIETLNYPQVDDDDQAMETFKFL